MTYNHPTRGFLLERYIETGASYHREVIRLSSLVTLAAEYALLALSIPT